MRCTFIRSNFLLFFVNSKLKFALARRWREINRRARFQRWLEQECGHHHGTLERAESSEIAANRSPPSTGLAHSTYVQVTTAARSSTFTALPSREESTTTIPPHLSLSWIISRLYLEISRERYEYLEERYDLFVFYRLENWKKLGEGEWILLFEGLNWFRFHRRESDNSKAKKCFD